MSLDENLVTETEDLKLTDQEIFTEIWTSPRKVFQFINDTSYDKFVSILLILAGIARAFDRATDKNMGDNLSLLAVLGICVILGVLIGWMSFYIYAALLSWTGGWLNAKGDSNSLLRMLSYAMLPSIVAMIFFIPQIVIFENAIFRSGFDINESELLPEIIYYATNIIGFLLGIWTLVLVVVGISEVQKLSIGKSILNMVLPVLIFLVPFAMIAFFLGDLFGK